MQPKQGKNAFCYLSQKRHACEGNNEPLLALTVLMMPMLDHHEGTLHAFIFVIYIDCIVEVYSLIYAFGALLGAVKKKIA